MHIGLDLGTSGVKGVVMDDGQTILAEADAPLNVLRPHPGWSEQDPADWIAATQTVLGALAEQVDMAAVHSIGISGQMHGATVLDAADTVLRPCILWNDTRASAEAAKLDADPQWRAVSGNIVFPGFTAPKLAWMADAERALFDRAAKVLLPKDYLRLWLTGEHVAEMSDAAGTSWLDTGARDWSDALLAETGLERSHMPRLVEGSDVSGTLRADVATAFGLSRNVVVAGGGGDNAASAIGVGVTQPGQAFLSLGTSGVLFAANDGYQPAPETAVHTFCHALPGAWHQMGVILSATDALNWFAGVMNDTPQSLTSALGSVQAPGHTLFLPYLGGERTPLNDAAIRAGFVGLDHAADRAAMTRAVLEGVAFALADCQDALAATGTQIKTCLAVGGGSQSEYWLGLLAQTLNLPIDVATSGAQGGAFGAARLGMMAATGDTSLATAPKIARSFEPDPAFGDAFAVAHDRYKRAAAAFQSLN